MKVPGPDAEAHEAMIADFEAELQDAQLSLLDSNKIVDKDHSGVTVKIPPDYLKAPQKG
jgi:hypothetical protein